MEYKKCNGYLVVEDTGIDEKDDIYPYVFSTKRDALDFIKERVADDWLRYGKPDKLVNIPYYIISLDNATNPDEYPEIEIVDKVSIYTTFHNGDIDFDQDVWNQFMTVPYDANCQISLVSLYYISVSNGSIDRIRFDFYLPESVCDKYEPNGEFEEILRMYCLEMTNLINNDYDKYCTNGIKIPAEDLNDLHKKACTIIAEKYNNETFDTLFRKEINDEQEKGKEI